MSTVRRGTSPASQFVIVSNQLARDDRLTFKARGLALWLLSHAEGWETSVAAIATAAGVGRDQVRTGLAELESAGYLRRERARDEAGRMGEVSYLIQCTPHPPEGTEPPGQDHSREIRRRVTRPRETRPHKKTTPVRETKTAKKTNPSGGAASAPEPTSSTEANMPTRTPTPPMSLPLEWEAEPAITPPPSTAQQVVAAYVESYRRHHSGGNPTRASIGRVGRDARAILEQGTAGPAELTNAATSLGTGMWDGLGRELSKLRQRPTRAAFAPVAAPGAFAVAAASADAEFVARLRAEPDLARWVLEDPAAVEGLIREHPDLADVFQAVAA